VPFRHGLETKPSIFISGCVPHSWLVNKKITFLVILNEVKDLYRDIISEPSLMTPTEATGIFIGGCRVPFRVWPPAMAG
jgi:hypothetical protein